MSSQDLDEDLLQVEILDDDVLIGRPQRLGDARLVAIGHDRQVLLLAPAQDLAGHDDPRQSFSRRDFVRLRRLGTLYG